MTQPRQETWIPVSQQHPCPACTGDSWCTWIPDEVIVCRRSTGGGMLRQDKDGADYWVHTLRTDGAPLPRVDPQPLERLDRLPVNQLDAAYRFLMKSLPLTDEDREWLREKYGLTDEEIKAGGFFSWPDPGTEARKQVLKAMVKELGAETCRRIPGISKPAGKPWTVRGWGAVAIPVFNEDGRIIAIRLRSRDPRSDWKYLWLSSGNEVDEKHHLLGPSPGAPCYVPTIKVEDLSRIRLTEGEIKALMATSRTGVLTISAPGVGQWRKAIELIRELEPEEVLLAFDADAGTNPHVARCLQDCFLSQTQENWRVVVETWDPDLGKGIDDLLRDGNEPKELHGAEAARWVLEQVASSGADVDPELTGRIALEELPAAIKEDPAALFAPAIVDHLARLKLTDEAAFQGEMVRLADPDRMGGLKLAVGKLEKAVCDKARRIKAEWVEEQKRAADPKRAQDPQPIYQQTDKGLVWNAPHPFGYQATPLTNWRAKITADSRRDDGSGETTREFTVEARLNGYARTFPVAARDFDGLGWMAEQIGAEAVLHPGQRHKDHAATAIRLLSGKISEQVVFCHTGWRQVDGRPVYLHAGGAIGADGVVEGISVELEPQWAPFQLPAPPTGKDLKQAQEASLALLMDCGLDDPLIFPLVAAVWRAPLGDSNLSIHLHGDTGRGKTALAVLIQQCFGAGFSEKSLPGSWTSTPNMLETLAFTGKDTLYTVDDFTDAVELKARADRLFRAQGNLQARGRLDRNAEMRAPRPPRGLLLSTGEELPVGLSLNARIVALEVKERIFNSAIDQAQEMAAEGVYASAMAGYLAWLAQDLPGHHATLRKMTERMRQQLRVSHARQVDNLAHLAGGLALWLEWMGEFPDKALVKERAEQAFLAVAQEQEGRMREADPVKRFLALIRSLLTTGQAHLTNLGGKCPVGQEAACGWKIDPHRSGIQLNDDGETVEKWVPGGVHIGWIEGEDVYLDPQASYQAAQEMGQRQRLPLTVRLDTLARRLDDAGLLTVEYEGKKKRLRARKRIAGRLLRVLNLKADHLFNDQ